MRCNVDEFRVTTANTLQRKQNMNLQYFECKTWISSREQICYIVNEIGFSVTLNVEFRI